MTFKLSPDVVREWAFLTPQQRGSMAEMAGYTTTREIAYRGWGDLTAQVRSDLLDVWAQWKERDCHTFTPGMLADES